LTRANLGDIGCFLLDMDGTIYLGRQLLPGADRFLAILGELGREYFFLTNNSSRDKLAYVEKLESMGIAVAPERVVTSGEATALYLQKAKPGAKLFLLGTEALARELVSHGFSLVTKKENPDYVVLGFDTTLTYQKLWDACDLIRDGVEFIATHPDFNCPLEGGKYMPDAGAMAAFIQASTGRTPKVIGKPHREIVDAVLSRTQVPRERTAMVGDRLYTDIALAQDAGLTGILVLSGESGPRDLAESPYRPDYVFPSVAELGAALLAGEEREDG
jgi:phosphoglycolate/pyridoxal phosphate phosphatase family enzyme